ncbi:MAG: hypothetical protein NT150_09460 [Bacteroidetes bacterium]|nr:hypothetical protein [Bacteroidota bacterium]
MKQNTNVTQAFPDTYYQLYDEEGSSVMLRAIKSDRNTITAEVSAKKMSEGMDFPASIISPFQPDSLGSSHFDTVTVNKKSLLAAFNADWQGEVQRINIGKYKKLRFLASYNLNIAIFAFTRFQKKGDHYIFTVKNIHKTATILKIEQDGHSNDMQLQSLKLPMTLNNGDTLQLMLRVLEENPWYYGLLVYKNNRNTEQTMRFELYENNMLVYNHDFFEE